MRRPSVGRLATGTHGTGARLRNLSAPVRSVELMLADGSQITLSPESDPDGWRAARVSLGALGVVTAVTLQALPAFRLRAVDGPAPLDETLERLDELAAAHDHFELYWFPYCDRALLRRNDRTEEPVTARSAPRAYFEDIVLVNHGSAGVLAARPSPPRPDPSGSTGSSPGWPARAGESTPRIVFSSPPAGSASPRWSTRSRASGPARRSVPCATPSTPAGCRSRSRSRSASSPVTTRCSSPAHGRDTCYIAAHVFDGMDFEPYFRVVEEIMNGFDGRPHWGKRHFQTAETLRGRYPEWDRFQAVRARLDPTGRFANAEVDRVLGPVTGS